MCSHLKRIPSLDGLRAIAIVMVLLFHASGTDDFPHWLAFNTAYGTFGVRIFFVISGYLITTLLVREREKTGTISLVAFYKRRAYRILPAAYIYIAAMAVFARQTTGWKDFLAATLYLENYYHQAPVFWHLWSLSVEEQFYLLWPPLLLFFFRKRFSIVVIAIAFAPLLRGIAYIANQRYMLGWFPSLEDGLAVGCLLALLGPRLIHWHRWIDKLILPIAALTLVLPGLHYPHGVEPTIALTLMYLGIALCVDHVIRHPYQALNNAPIEWVGRLSYSLYLWQEPFLFLHEIHTWWTRFPLNFVLAFTCALLSYYLIEKPFLALRDHRNTAKKRATIASSANA